MATPNSTFSEIAVVALQGYSKTIADNVSNHNALLNRISKKGNTQTATGRTIVQEMDFTGNTTGQWYSGSQTLDVSASEVLTAAEFAYKEYNVNVVINGLEEIQNSGEEAVHNFLKARIKNAERTARNDIATACYATGTGSDGKEIGGLQLLVADDPTTGTVGGINRATSGNEFWRNTIYDLSTNSVTLSATTITSVLNTLWLTLTRGMDHPDMLTANSTYYQFYEASLQSIHRIASDKEANAGFESLKYKSADFFYDDVCPANRLYMLNTDFLHFRPAKGKNFTTGSAKEPYNQDAKVIPMYWKGNMTCSNAALQGVVLP